MTLHYKLTFEGAPVLQFWPRGLLRADAGDRRDGPVFPDLDLDVLNVDELAEVVEFFTMIATRAEEIRQTKVIHRADVLTANVAEEAGRPLPVPPIAVAVPEPEPEPEPESEPEPEPESPRSTVPEGSQGGEWSVSITDPSGGGAWRGRQV